MSDCFASGRQFETLPSLYALKLLLFFALNKKKKNTDIKRDAKIEFLKYHRSSFLKDKQNKTVLAPGKLGGTSKSSVVNNNILMLTIIGRRHGPEIPSTFTNRTFVDRPNGSKTVMRQILQKNNVSRSYRLFSCNLNGLSGVRRHFG